MLDAAILGEPGVLQARQRLALRVRSTTRTTPPGRAVSSALGGASAAARTVLHPGAAKLRAERGVAALLPAARSGARYAGGAPRLFAAVGEHRERLRNDLALQTAEDVAATLGTMKGVLMKLGQMASYVNQDLSPAARRTLSRLQDSAPGRLDRAGKRRHLDLRARRPRQRHGTPGAVPGDHAGLGRGRSQDRHGRDLPAQDVTYSNEPERAGASSVDRCVDRRAG
jgi:hypothetical protein